MTIKVTKRLGTVLIQTTMRDMELDTDEALVLLEALSGIVPALPASPMRLGQDENAAYVLICPRCGVESTPYEVDLGMRRNTAEFEMRDDGAHLYVSQGERDFETVAWRCDKCDRTVDIPPEIEVTWD